MLVTYWSRFTALSTEDFMVS